MASAARITEFRANELPDDTSDGPDDTGSGMLPDAVTLPNPVVVVGATTVVVAL